MIFPRSLVLLALSAAAAAAVLQTFPATDPQTGRALQCDTCKPGTYLRAACTENRGTECAPCPRGSYTEVWNYISTCLRCGVCALNEVERAPCSAVSDCRCECKPGYFRRNGMCVLHSECPAGEGVSVAGTLSEDTVCQVCSNNTFSDTISANQSCQPHRNCEAAGLQLLMKGTVWHDNICISCQDFVSREEAAIIRKFLPAFFAHQRISERRLRRILRRLLPHGRTRPNHSDPLAEISRWTHSATLEQLHQLPGVMREMGARNAHTKLEQKLKQVSSYLQRLCNPIPEV